MSANQTQTLYIVISVLNEQENIVTLAQNCRNLIDQLPENIKPSFIFIDDGSTDRTAEFIHRYFNFAPLFVMHHNYNVGPGAAFATAFRHLNACLQPTDWVLTMEGDNTSSPELVAQMFRRAEEGYDVILASPYMYGGTIVNTSRFRKILSFSSNLFLKELLGLRGIFTMSSFFRLHRGSVIRYLQTIFGPTLIQSKGFEGVVELLMKMVFLNIKLSEVPLILDTAKRKGKSKMKVFKTAVKLLMLFKDKHHWKKICQDNILQGNTYTCMNSNIFSKTKSLTSNMVYQNTSEHHYIPAPEAPTSQPISSTQYHEHYDHYNSDMVKRLDGFYGAVETTIHGNILKHVVGKKVLDIGCGFGSLAHYLQNKGLEVLGIDQHEISITAGKQKFPNAPIELFKGSLADLPDKSFDTVVMKDVIHHVLEEGDIQEFLTQAKRIAQHRVIIVDPNPTLILKICRKIIQHIDPICKPETAKKYLSALGFKPIKTFYSEFVAFPLSGGFVGPELIKTKFLQKAFLKIDTVLNAILKTFKIDKLLCWRYYLIADVNEF